MTAELRVRTPRLELRLPTEDELHALAEVALAGIHPPERTPFYVPWTDRAHLPGFREEFVAHHRAATSGAFEDNPQSRRVSEKLGYREVGTRTVAPRGTPVVERLYRLDRADWASPVAVELVGVEAVFSIRSDPPL